MSDREPQSADKYIVRFPPGMRQRLKDAAQENNRSLNAEIIARLQASFEEPAEISEEQADKVIERMWQRLGISLDDLVKMVNANRTRP